MTAPPNNARTIQGGLSLWVNAAQAIEWKNDQGRTVYRLKQPPLPRSSHVFLQLRAGNKLVWRSAPQTQALKLTPFFEPRLGDALLFNNAELVAEAKRMLSAKPRKFLPYSLVYRDRSDPYDLDENDEEAISLGAMTTIAEPYVSEEDWCSYYFLSKQRAELFGRVTQHTCSTLQAAVGPPIKSGKPDPQQPWPLSTSPCAWQVGQQWLAVAEKNDSGDGDFEFQVALVVVPVQKKRARVNRTSRPSHLRSFQQARNNVSFNGLSMANIALMLRQFGRLAPALMVLSATLSACGGGNTNESDTTEFAHSTSDTTHVARTFAAPAARPVRHPAEAPDRAQARALLTEGARLNALELERARTDSTDDSQSPNEAHRKDTAPTPIYRFYNRRSTAHFYSKSAVERDNILANLPHYSLDGVAFMAKNEADDGLDAVHRFYNTQTGVHFYTISATEKAHVQATLPQFHYEGVAYYASKAPMVGAKPLYRFFYASKGFHFYTTQPEEVRQLSQYIDEGVGYYVFGTDADNLVPVTVRVQGLAIGGVLGLSQGSTTMRVDINGDHVFPGQLPAGSALGSMVSEQPQGQLCAIASPAPDAVPADGSPVFVRCVTSSAPRVVMPATLPNAPLTVEYGYREVAFPGIPYESRPGVVGGQFPYEYRLKSLTRNGVAQSTAAVSLDFRRGTLRFTPETEGTYVVTLNFKDSAANQQNMEKSFSIQALASRFKFVSPSGLDAVGGGSIVAPLRSLNYALSHSTPDQVIVLRRGTYASNGFTLNDTHAKQILAYPSEVATLDLNHAGGISVNSDQAPMARLEGLDVTRVRQYGVISDPSKAGLVVRQVNFRDGEEGSSPSENPAFIHAWGDTSSVTRHRLLIQDNWFGPYQMKSSGAYALTLFDAGHSLIENNQMRMGRTSGGIHDKDNSQYNTHRENYIAFSEADAVQGGIQVSAQANAENVHIHHNLMINAGIYLGIQCFQPACYMKNHDVHHNTLVGSRMAMNWGPFQPSSEGTRFSFNIIQSGPKAPYGGLSCQSRPPGLSTQLSAGSNLLISSSALAFKDSECTGNDMSWAVWQDTYGFDTVASNSTLTNASVLVGKGPQSGLPLGDARIRQFGHQY